LNPKRGKAHGFLQNEIAGRRGRKKGVRGCLGTKEEDLAGRKD